MAALEHPSPSYTPVLCGVLDQRRDDMDRDCALIDAPESPEVLIDADAGFDAEVLAEHPRHERVLTFAGRDAGMARSEDTLELRVALADGPSWIGRFEGGYPSPAALTTVRSGPGFGQLLVVNRGAGFLVPAADPAAAVELDVGRSWRSCSTPDPHACSSPISPGWRVHHGRAAMERRRRMGRGRVARCTTSPTASSADGCGTHPVISWWRSRSTWPRAACCAGRRRVRDRPPARRVLHRARTAARARAAGRSRP